MPERFRFLIDEGSLSEVALEGAERLSEAFESLVAIVQETREHGVGKHTSVWEAQLGGHRLYEWLFENARGIDREVATALQIALDRSPDWDAAWPPSGLPEEVEISGVAQKAISVSAAIRETRQGHAVGCLSCRASRSGRLPVLMDGLSTDVHFISLSGDVLAFFRDVPEIEDLDEDAYFANARYAFPRVRFVRDRTHFRHFEESYKSIRRRVTAHLSVINDHGRSVLDSAEPASAKQARFGSYGINASGESAQTRADKKAMKQREVSVGDRVIVCDWHTKLRPHIDRIYFNATSTTTVVVGAFRDHLD